MRSIYQVLSKQERLQVASEGGTVEIRVSQFIRQCIPSCRLEGLGSAVSSPSGVWGGAPAEIDLVHVSLKIRHLVTTILMIFLRINWPNFVKSFRVVLRRFRILTEDRWQRMKWSWTWLTGCVEPRRIYGKSLSTHLCHKLWQKQRHMGNVS